MALIKPLSLKEIQRNLARPKSMEYASPEELKTYYSRLIKTANSRIRRLEQKSIDSYAVRNLRAELEHVDALSYGGYAKYFESGDFRRYRSAVKSIERFLSSQISTITGIREYAKTFKEDMKLSFGLTDKEAAAWAKASYESGLSEEVLYKIEQSINEYMSDHPTIEVGSERFNNDLFRFIDTHIIAVDDNIEPIINKIINDIKSGVSKTRMKNYWNTHGRRR